MFINDKREGVCNFLCDFCQISVHLGAWTNFEVKIASPISCLYKRSVSKLRNNNEVIFPKLLETAQAAPRGVLKGFWEIYATK